MEKYCIYIVLTRMNTTIARLIRIIKKDDFTHAAISLDKQLNTCIAYWKYTYSFCWQPLKKILIKAYKFGKTLYGAVLRSRCQAAVR